MGTEDPKIPGHISFGLDIGVIGTRPEEVGLLLGYSSGGIGGLYIPNTVTLKISQKNKRRVF
jgi:hypothetical protein